MGRLGRTVGRLRRRSVINNDVFDGRTRRRHATTDCQQIDRSHQHCANKPSCTFSNVSERLTGQFAHGSGPWPCPFQPAAALTTTHRMKGQEAKRGVVARVRAATQARGAQKPAARQAPEDPDRGVNPKAPAEALTQQSVRAIKRAAPSLAPKTTTVAATTRRAETACILARDVTRSANSDSRFSSSPAIVESRQDVNCSVLTRPSAHMSTRTDTCRFPIRY